MTTLEEIEIAFSCLQDVIETEHSEERKTKLIRFKRQKSFEFQQLKSELSCLLQELESLDYN